MKIIILTLVCIVVGNMAARMRRSDDDDDDDDEEVATAANERFTARMFSEVVKHQPRKSVVMSAFSLLSPLGQLELAADGETRAELDSLIGIPSSSFNGAFQWMNYNLQNVGGVEIKEASKIYISKGAELNDSYAEIAREVFESVPENVDFSDKDAAVAKINSWVEEQTDNNIKDLVNPNSVSSNTAAVLVNALYFKGNWDKQFEYKKTQDRVFHVSKYKDKKLPTMHRRSIFNYAEIDSLDAKVVELPYVHHDTAMIIILPNEENGIKELEGKLTDTLLRTILENMRLFVVDVYLPKFKIETTIDLKKVLGDMKVKKIFTKGEANLKNLLKNNSDMYIGEAIQKVFVDVNEIGTNSEDANAIFGTGRMDWRLENRTFDANQPFVFKIVQERTFTLFSGVFQPKI